MNVRDTVLCLCKADPDCTKWTAYEQFFSTIGNGYRWYKGEIVSDVYFRASISESDRDALIKTDHFYGKVSKALDKRANDFRESKDARIIIDNTNSRCRFELIYNVPPDVTPNWKAAVDEWNAELKRTSRVFSSVADAVADMKSEASRERIRKKIVRRSKKYAHLSEEEREAIRKAHYDKEMKLIDFRFARDASQRLDMKRIGKK